jgi:hypothetical protein
MESKKIIVNDGKYKFQITDNTMVGRGVNYRTFKIGGESKTCVDISVDCMDKTNPIAVVLNVKYNSKCSIDGPLENGSGTVLMCKTLFNYVHKQFPTLTELNFDDKSTIECANEDEIKNNNSKTMNEESYIKPADLYYFYIASNGKTWYEKHFNARQKDVEKHSSYRTKIKDFLYSKERKGNTSFSELLERFKINQEIRAELEPYYEKAETIGAFFQSIKKDDRCRLLRDWITAFMRYHLHDVFSNRDWIIELPLSTKGGKRMTKKRRVKRVSMRTTIYKKRGVRL